MVDEEATTDDGARVDLDAGRAAGDVADQTRRILESIHPQPVSKAIRIDRLNAGINRGDLEPRSGSGVSSEDTRHVLDEHLQRIWRLFLVSRLFKVVSIDYMNVC